MKKYRLKKEATPFFTEKLATAVADWETWKELNVDDKALEEVKQPYINYGQKTECGGNSLCGWGNDKADFRFTIHFPTIRYHEYSQMSNGRMVRELMDQISDAVGHYFDNLLIDDKDERD